MTLTPDELYLWRNTYPWLWYCSDNTVEEFSQNKQAIELYHQHKLNHYENHHSKTNHSREIVPN